MRKMIPSGGRTDNHLEILISIIFLVIICALSITMRILPYIVNFQHFEVGFDTGLYEQLLLNYANARSWPLLPAYPDFSPAFGQYSNSIEPGFFVTISLAYNLVEHDIHTWFRYYLPSLTGLITVLIAFVAGKRLSGSSFGGWISSIVISFSYIQIDAINESYYRQIFGTLILVMSLIYLDKYIKTNRRKDIILFMVLASGIIAYHIAITLLLSFACAIGLALLIKHHKRSSIRYFILSVLGIGFLSAPAWASRTEVILTMLLNALSEGLRRLSTLSSGEGLWAGGGAIPQLLWGYPHILLGYVLFFPLLVFFSLIGYRVLWREHGVLNIIPLLSVVLWVYIGFWLFFGNRFLLNLDFLLCIIAPVTIVHFKKHLVKQYRIRTQVFLLISLTLLLILPVAMVSINCQLKKTPYITENIEGVEWIETNITKQQSVIFAPDYLSANLIQRGYLMAVWDFSLSNDSVHPMILAEEFMVNAPSNLTFLREFFTEHPDYKEKQIYVLWGTWDLDRPLVMTKKLIPVDEYASSPYFRCVYHGYGEILYIYEYVGPFAF